jgi:hypothetical protein
MNLSVTTIVLGEAVLTQSRALDVYWAVWFLGANLFVRGYEKPTLRRLFGASYDEYTQQVGRRIPRFRSRCRSQLNPVRIVSRDEFSIRGQTRFAGDGLGATMSRRG